MVIIGLVVAGVAITLDKQKKRQAAKAQLESENQGINYALFHCWQRILTIRHPKRSYQQRHFETNEK